jgi:hypothetical protein
MRLETGVITSEFQDFILDLTLLIVRPFTSQKKSACYSDASVILHEPQRLGLISLSCSAATVYETKWCLAGLLEDSGCG